MNVVLKAEGDAFWENDSITFAAIDEDLSTDIIIGEIDLFNRDAFNHHAEVGVWVDEKYRRKGYASKMLRQILLVTSPMPSIYMLYADIVESNHASQNLFTKAGFQRSCILPQWHFNGMEYENVVRYTIIPSMEDDMCDIACKGSEIQ